MLLTRSSSTTGVGRTKPATSFLRRFPPAKRLTRPLNEQRRSSGRQGRASRSNSKTALAVGMRKTKGETIDLTLRSRINGWTWQDASQQREYPILSHRENNRAGVQLIADRSRNCVPGTLFFLALQAQQRRRMYRHKNPKPVLRSEDRTAIALNRDRLTYQPLRGRGAKRDNKTRAYRLDLLK